LRRLKRKCGRRGGIRDRDMINKWEEELHELIREFSASISFDKRLYRQDIEGSKAYCRMLARKGIITNKEGELILSALDEILHEIEENKLPLSTRLEDIHMNVENRLIEKIGEVGGKLHTGRSRNDQIALDIRMFLREEIKEIIALIKKLMEAIVTLAESNQDVAMPGYTHLQRAQPILFAHHCMAYYEMFKRDRERFSQCLDRVNVMPLGSAALAGSGFPIDREFLAEILGFSRISSNSIDAVSDRDFALEYLANCSILAVHMSRLCEELIIWSTEEFGFVSLSPHLCTGSSIMPQKKNPDLIELIRGKTGRIFGNLISLLTIMKGLPLAYNKDMQEDKIPIFDSTDTIKASLKVLAEAIRSLEVKRERMEEALEGGFLTATDLADYLVEKGMSFRRAHSLAGNIVHYCRERGKTLDELTIDELKAFHESIGEDVKNILGFKGSLNRRSVYGGTSPERVREAIIKAKEELLNE
jgi:argininosuccinate lyase